jgi:hypothetical protein
MDGSTAPSLAGGQADNQIGQGDVGPEPRHQAVLAIAFGSTAALAFDAHDGMRELATRVLPPAPARKASDGTRTGGKDAPSAVDYHERAPCVRHRRANSPRDPQRRAIALRLQKRLRLPFPANLL